MRLLRASACSPIANDPSLHPKKYRWTLKINPLARLDGRSGVLAVVGGALGDRLGLVSGGGALELLADLLDAGSASAGDSGSATEVGVDTSKKLARVGL
jgi:hypothetical protein